MSYVGAGRMLALLLLSEREDRAAALDEHMYA